MKNDLDADHLAGARRWGALRVAAIVEGIFTARSRLAAAVGRMTVADARTKVGRRPLPAQSGRTRRSRQDTPRRQGGRILLKNSRLIAGLGVDSIPASGGRIGDDGAEAGSATRAVLRVLAGGSRRPRSPASLHRPVRRLGRHPRPPGGFLQPHGPSVCRSRTSDPDAPGRLLLWYPLRAPALRRGASELGVSLVLPAQSVGPGP